MSLLFWFGRGVLKLAMTFWHRVLFEGVEHIPARGGYIICSNHYTYMDVAYITWKLRIQAFFMAKSELFRNPLFGFILKKLGAFPVERGKGDTSAVDRAIDLIKDGKILAIFPEGTRSKDGKLMRGKSGVSLIASRASADVLPVGIKYEEPRRFRSKVVVRYGSLIDHKELKIVENKPSDIKAVTTRIMSEIAALLEEAP